MREKKTTIEIHAMNPELGKMLDAAYDEYVKEHGDAPAKPYRVLYWFIRWSETFHTFTGKSSERVVVVKD